MGRSVTVDFTTGTTVIAASVVTDPVALLTNPFSQTLRTFEMRAIRDADGQVTGTFVGFYPETGVRFSGRVTCFTIVGGNATWVGGIIDSSSDAAAGSTGQSVGWRAVDNGTPTALVHDQLSLLWPDLGADGAANWCANTPLTFPDSSEALLIDLLGGDIIVNPSGAPPAPPPPPPPPPPPDSSSMSQIAFWTPYEVIYAMKRSRTTGTSTWSIGMAPVFNT